MTTGTEKRKPLGWRIARAAGRRAFGLLLFIGIALTGGFFAFAHWVSVMPAGTQATAGGIVVLTGDEDRISEAVRLLAQGKASRLLISGVYKRTGPTQIISMNGTGPDEASLFKCCVDLGKDAANTEANASEAAAWTRKMGFHSIIVVTSTYHMPRTLIELRQSMPEASLIPCPVKSSRMETEWWNDPKTTWVLFKEYLKFVTASARYAANLFAPSPSNAKQSGQSTINARMH